MLLDDATRFTARAVAAGNDVTLEVWPYMVHAWHLFAGVPESDAALGRVAAFRREHLGLGREGAV